MNRIWVEFSGDTVTGSVVSLDISHVSAVMTAPDIGQHACVVICDGQRYVFHSISYADMLKMLQFHRKD